MSTPDHRLIDFVESLEAENARLRARVEALEGVLTKIERMADNAVDARMGGSFTFAAIRDDARALLTEGAEHYV